MIFQDIQSMDENRSWHSTFQQLNIKAREKAGSQKAGKSAANRVYNRYRDVVPYDHSLVRLRNSDTEYINANLVKVSSIDKKYILTQGPLANTCKHFWEMVWEQNAHSIVMLNRVIEKNQLKCHQYWPLSGSLTTGNIKVTLKEQEDFNEFVVRVLELEHTEENKTRTIQHFHYIAWPDFGVPSSPQAFLKYLLNVREYQSSISGVGPPVIHCSAGIGRSGTFALIDAALTEIQQKDDMMDYDVKKVLLEMRTYRAGLIQTTEQLRFSYIAILEGANMVAPAAYGAAYWKMANQEESEEEEEYEEDETERPGKRIAGSEQEESEEPKAKEPRKEEPPEESSESEGDEEEIVNLDDIDTDVVNDSDKKEQEPESTVFQEEDTTGSDRDKGGTNENTKVDNVKNEVCESFVRDKDNDTENLVLDREIKTSTMTTKDAPTDANVNATEKRHEQLETKDEVAHERSDNIESTSDNKESVQGVASGRFPSAYNVFSTSELSESSSVERVVGRWQSGDNENTESNEGGVEPRPKRSAMRTNSTEGKRKSVTFMQENGEAEKGVDEDSTSIDEKTESSILRRRQYELRKQNLSNKVDSIKKKMKEHEEEGSFFGKTMLAGLVICVVVAGVAFFYYRYQS